jgi:sulfur carrier protein
VGYKEFKKAKESLPMMLTLKLNGESRQFPPLMTVAQLVDELGYTGKRMAVERNGDIVPKSLHGSTCLENGDVVEIVVAVGGG